MRTLKTFEGFHLNEKKGEMIGTITSPGVNEIEIKDGENFVTITQQSVIADRKNVVVLPYVAIKELIEMLDAHTGYNIER